MRIQMEIHKLTERLLDAEPGIPSSEVVLYNVHAEWKTLLARLNALEFYNLGNVGLHGENVLVPDSDAKD